MQVASDTNYAAPLNPEDDYTMERASNTNIHTKYNLNISLVSPDIKSSLSFHKKSFLGDFK